MTSGLISLSPCFSICGFKGAGSQKVLLNPELRGFSPSGCPPESRSPTEFEVSMPGPENRWRAAELWGIGKCLISKVAICAGCGWRGSVRPTRGRWLQACGVRRLSRLVAHRHSGGRPLGSSFLPAIPPRLPSPSVRRPVHARRPAVSVSAPQRNSPSRGRCTSPHVEMGRGLF